MAENEQLDKLTQQKKQEGLPPVLQTFHLRTYGCQMNELDSEVMSGILQKRGMISVEEESRADLLIFNTCSIRDLAERKVMGKVGLLKRKNQKKQIIGITGCMVTAKKEKLFKKLPHIHFLLGPDHIGNLSVALDEIIAGKKHVGYVNRGFEENIDYLLADRRNPVKAYVSIIRGCDKHCTYCVVPYTRGQEISRPLESILEECSDLARKGYKEIVLLGQNVNSYGKDFSHKNILFHDLLYHIDKIPGIERIRFLTSHPIDITVELMQAIRDLPAVCESVHFPIQSGSTRILRKMHRIYTLEQYLEKVSLLREIVPNVHLGTDIIVGFPTETEEDFLATFHIMEQIRYSLAFLYTYSPRKGTPAMRWKDDIPEEVKNERLRRLKKLHQEIRQEQLQNMVGTEQEVLIERIGVEKEGTWQVHGRTRHGEKVTFFSSASRGSLQTVSIYGYSHETLLGK